MVRYKQVADILRIMKNLEQVRNIGITAHVDHGKTTLSDSLLAAAGIISEKVAGEALALDYLDVEQKRGITVKSANISLYHEYHGKPYVINLIDTPGHVDFSSRTTRSLRVLDGAILVVDAVEGVMTQTEMYLRMALEERVRPLLFINKVDRLIKELKLTPSEIQQRFVQIIKEVNSLIAMYADKPFKSLWQLDPAKGHVAFGSAKDRWGFTVPMAQKRGIKFSDIIAAYQKGTREAIEEIQKVAVLHEAILDMVVKFVPNPRDAQKYRIPKIWRGDLNSEIGKAMIEADPDGPVVTVAIEPKNPAELPKLIDALHKISIEDPSLVVKINEETGEYLLSGMGTLHIEIALTFLKENYGLTVDVSPPVIVYRESIRESSKVFEGKSPNKHNKLYIHVEPLDQKTIELIAQGIIVEDMDAKERAKILRNEAGWDYDEAKRIWAIDENINVFIDKTTGVQHLREVKDTIIQGFRLAMREGPLAMEPVRGVKVVLHDAIIHEDPAHRGPGQLYPAVRNAIYAGMLTSRPTLLEPIMKLDIRVPMEFMGNVSSVITKRRGRILQVLQQGPITRIIAEIPVAETFDLAEALRSATAGKALWGQEFSRWAPVPDSMLLDLVRKIRERKGLKPEPPKPSDFIGF